MRIICGFLVLGMWILGGRGFEGWGGRRRWGRRM
jgi:hypothetical protein